MKRRKSLMSLLLHLALLMPGFSQDKANQMITFSGGLSWLARQDLIYSPLVHSDHSFHSFGLKYQRDKKYFQYAETGFAYNQSLVGEPYEMDMDDHAHMILPHEFLNIHLSYGIGKLTGESRWHREWAGISVRQDIQAGFYNFALSNMFGYFISQSANVWYKRAYTYNKHQIVIHAELPVLAWVARPPYLAEDDEFIENISSHNSVKILLAFVGDGKPVTWNKVQRFNLHLEYSYPVTKRINIGLDYRFSFIHSHDPKTLLSYQQQWHITTAIKF